MSRRGLADVEHNTGSPLFEDDDMLRKLIRDQTGGEVLEYAPIAGLIIVGAIALITSVGTKVLARWTSLNSSL